MRDLQPRELAAEVASPHYWRRQTARRLLVERQATSAVPYLVNLLNDAPEPYVVLNLLQTLDGLHQVAAGQVRIALNHADWSVRRQGLRFAERWLMADKERTSTPAEDLLAEVLPLVDDPHPAVRLQAALTLGESVGEDTLAQLAELGRSYGDELWMPLAILTSVADRSHQLLEELLSDPDQIGQATQLLESLSRMIASTRDGDAITRRTDQHRRS